MSNDMMGDDGYGDDGFDLVGDEGDGMGDMMGAGPIRLGRPAAGGFFRPQQQQQQGRTLQLPPKPQWRQQIAPGVSMPRQTMEPLPLTPQAGNGVFTAALTSIQYQARPQRPFRGERIVAVIGRIGASAAGVVPVLNGLIVGTQVQQVELGAIPLDVFAPTSFGVRLSIAQAEPGVLISGEVALVGALAGADTITVRLVILGRSIAG